MDSDMSGTTSPAPAVPPFLAKVRASRAAAARAAAAASSSATSVSAMASTGGGSSAYASGSASGYANGNGSTSGNGNGSSGLSGTASPLSIATATGPDDASGAAAGAAGPGGTTGGTGGAGGPPPSASQSQPPPNALYLLPPAAPSVEEDLVPPENFAAVTQGVYRCGFPKKRNFKFLETLQLKTVLTLVLEDYPEANLQWCQDQDIQFMQFGIPGNKEPFDNIPEDVICSALVAILDRRNHPILIHCNKGKHRTGCLIGCIRRLQSWSLTSIFDEYRRFSSPKSRAVDQQFIDLFDIAPVWDEVVALGGGLDNLPNWPMLTLPLALAAERDAKRERANERERRATVASAAAAAAAARIDMIETAPIIEAMEIAAR